MENNEQREMIHWTIPETDMEEQYLKKSMELQDDKERLAQEIDKFSTKYKGLVWGFAIVKNPGTEQWRLEDVIMDARVFR